MKGPAMASTPRTVLLTGGTGFLGSFLAAGLLERGVHVAFLARNGQERSAQQRVHDVLRWHGHADADLATGCTVLAGDLAEPRFGLADGDYADVARDCTEVWHCASETTFSVRKRELLERVNVAGTEQVLQFARDSRAEMVNYIGTAYSVGRAVGECAETLEPRTQFHNPYEETKHRAEMLLAHGCEEDGLPFLVYRPSIIAGDHLTGRTLLYNGLYYPLRMLDYFRRQVLRDCEEGDGSNARALGARVTGDGRVELPVRLPVRREGGTGLNIVAVDWVRDACLRLREGGEPGTVHNLVNDTAMSLDDLSTAIRDVLGIDGVELSAAADADAPAVSPLDAQFRSRVQVYLPYMGDQRVFRRDRSRAVLGDLLPPPVDLGYLERCLKVALADEWTSPLP